MALGVVLGACVSSSPFECRTNAECGAEGVSGFCEDTGYCSFPDAECASERRYGDYAPADLVRVCVPTPPTDETTATTSGDPFDPTTTITTSPGDEGDSGSTTSSVMSDEGGTSGEPGDTSGSTTQGATTTEGGTTTGELVDTDLVAWYPLAGEPEGDVVVDASGYGLHGSCAEGSCFSVATGAPLGNAAEFDGVNDLVRVPHDSLFETIDGFTVAAWARLDVFPPAGENRHVVAKPYGSGYSNSWELNIRDVGSNGVHDVVFSLFDGSGAGNVGPSVPATFEPGEWVHLVGRWDGSRAEIYIDGTFAAEHPLTNVFFDEHDLVIGADDDYEGATVHWYWEGGISDVRLYRRALSADEIAALATAPSR